MNSDIILRNKYRFFSVGAIGTFMSTLDGSILNVALPTIANEFQSSIDVVAWVILAYALTIVSLMMIFGTWVERKGYGFAYKFGYIFFLAGSLTCVAAGSIEILIAGRVIQAIGSAMFQAIGPGLVTTVFPKRERGKGIGMIVMMVSAGLMTGPPLGGVILQHFPWQIIFAINIPIGLVGLFLTSRYFKLLPIPETTHRLHLRGAVSISVTLLSGTLALSLISDYSLINIRVWGLLILSGTALVIFFKSESNPQTALFGLDLFRNRQFTNALIAAVLIFIALASTIVFIPFYLERVKNYGPQTVGLFLIISPFLMFIVAPLSGKLSDRIGSRFLTTIGMLTLTFGLYLLSTLGETTSAEFIILCLVITSVGNAVFNTPNSSSLMGSVTPDKRAVASGVLATSRNIGIAIGVALSTSLFAFFESIYASGTTDPVTLFVKSFHPVMLAAMVTALIGVPFCLSRKK
ncbi:MAG: hypothetical protein DRP47_00195 [Candidatus Zixiibacteriota bacterium]|nr:MAG: hypothetical protein DRP47_00195 [candidate division Zixibacteria bacterium]